ncbi:MAG: bifunctional phosphopantothenoylcysteine decarboxylase/phosphopantothenate--cysteine ligase CoaBC [Nitrospirota bacterium]|nr:bifunctional phosphopantothenoylcysteine decarboxylase/phosphopantothenate--cysteine ligase CoaBC [Nitrospirota bacterium]
MRVLDGKRVTLGVTGSIAAYKAVGLLRAFMREGADVSVVLTQAATRFVTPLTFETLSKHPVATDLFAAQQDMPHLMLPERADAVIVAPATANCLAKCALGLADDLLSTLLLNVTGPLIIAPAMDGGMWHHQAVQTHVATLRSRGVLVLDPDEGPLASGRVGIGRLAEDSRILAALEQALAPKLDWVGQRLLVSAGPTQEAIDPIRFISNRSSGKMGYAIAQAARARGAAVTLVSGPTALPPPSGVDLVHVVTAEDMQKALLARLAWSTVVVMAAAVADFRPLRAATAKLKKDGGYWKKLDLAPTDDILLQLSQQRRSQVLVGFAAETESVLTHAAAKLKRKGLDLIVGNNVAAEGSGFGSDTNAATLIDREGRVQELALMPKRELADRILDAALALTRSRPGRPHSTRRT